MLEHIKPDIHGQELFFNDVDPPGRFLVRGDWAFFSGILEGPNGNATPIDYANSVYRDVADDLDGVERGGNFAATFIALLKRDPDGTWHAPTTAGKPTYALGSRKAWLFWTDLPPAPARSIFPAPVPTTGEPSVPASCATCTFVPQTSMRGVELGMTREAVKGLLGEPDLQEERRDFGLWGDATAYHFGKTNVLFTHNSSPPKAFFIETESTNVKTPDGVGIGSTEHDLTARVAGLTCEADFDPDTGDLSTTTRSCFQRGAPDPRTFKGVMTSFTLVSGKVTSMFLGWYFDGE
jgi:hypothetical protein